MEHFYQNISGFMKDSNKSLFDRVINSLQHKCNWVEVGSFTGQSAAYCIVELLKKNKLGEFTCIDSWSGGPEHQNLEIIKENKLYETFNKNLQPCQGKYKSIKSLSWEAAELFTDESLDFVYIDADHRYESVTKDLEAWWPKVKTGCYFAGDDYTKGHPGVIKAVQDFFPNKTARRMGRCWIVKKV